MYNVEDYNINISRGDTGALRVNAKATLDGELFTFGENDRALFSVKAGNGEIILQKVCAMTDNSFVVYFLNGDTENLAPGSYSWDVRYVINPYFDDEGHLVNGDQIITPRAPMALNLLTVVGDV